MSCKYNNCKICGYKTECEIYKENAELEKSCDETQELLDKQIEATYKLDKENAELKARVEKQNGDILFLKGLTERLRAKIQEMKSDVKEYFGYEYNILVAKLLNKWEIKENE